MVHSQGLNESWFRLVTPSSSFVLEGMLSQVKMCLKVVDLRCINFNCLLHVSSLGPVEVITYSTLSSLCSDSGWVALSPIAFAQAQCSAVLEALFSSPSFYSLNVGRLISHVESSGLTHAIVASFVGAMLEPFTRLGTVLVDSLPRSVR
ncbi:hypothetical protein V6N13_072275 [Hibiscus sabdariffa]